MDLVEPLPNPINGFRPAATDLCFWPLRQLATPIDGRASSIWCFQRIQDRLLCRLPYIQRNLLHSNDMAKSAQLLDISTLYNVFVVEELIQLTVGSVAEITANSYWTKDLT